MTKSEDERTEQDEVEAARAPPGLAGLSVEVATPLYPTEDPGAVRAALLSLFPTLELDLGGGRAAGAAEGPRALARLRARLREMRIRDTARSVLASGIGEGRLTFTLNKQSACARVPNFSTGGAPLGDIEVTVVHGDPAAVVEWLCETDDP